MDRIPDLVASASTTPQSAPPPRRPVLARIGTATISAAPWAIIAGLLWAGLFIKPQPVGKSVQPPVLERRDHYYGLAIPAPGTVWLAGSDGKILSIAPDGGATRLPTPTHATLQDIAAWDARHAVAVGNGGVILNTSDGGASWQKATEVPRSEVANKLTRVTVDSASRALAVGEMGALLASDDGGRTWRRLREEEDVAWNDIAAPSPARLVVVGEFGRIVTSEDDGATWTEVTSGVESSLMAVAFRDASHGVAVGLEGVVLVTADGGLSWQPAALPLRDHLFDIAWDAQAARWLGTGDMGRWIAADDAAANWQAGRLDARDMSWHTRVVPEGAMAWFSGANAGRWDGSRWSPLTGG